MLIHTAVESDIPTLLISGEFDPGTPPAFAQIAVETLSRSYSLVMPYRGHTDGFSNPCQQQIADAFWDHPEQEPDASCIKDLEQPGFWVKEDSRQ